VKRDYRVRFVPLIHDLIPLTQPSFVDPDQRAAFGSWIAASLAKAELALTVSRHSRDELIEMAKAHGWTLPVVQVLPLGGTFSSWRPRQMAEMPADAPALPERFVLCVSTIEPRKNHRLLLEIWRRLIARHGADFVPDLVWVGHFSGPIGDFRRELLSSNDLRDKLRLLTGLSDEALAEAYRRCLFTVYPSFCEGWGLPVAESLTHGKFCVASDRTSLPEVGGRFVDYFDPADIDDALAKIERPLLDPAYLATREALLCKAYRPASWSDCARSLVETVDRLGSQRFSQEARV
jgi:glycosyltransferase involved in cell wall biosynthesis